MYYDEKILPTSYLRRKFSFCGNYMDYTKLASCLCFIEKYNVREDNTAEKMGTWSMIQETK